MTATEKRCWKLVKRWRKQAGYALSALMIASELESALKPHKKKRKGQAKC